MSSTKNDHRCVSTTISVKTQKRVKVCRICLEDENNEDMVSPCRCRGSMKFIHYACLVKCVESLGSTRCGVCLHKYAGVRVQIYERSFKEFFETNQHNCNEIVAIFGVILGLQMALIYQYWFAQKTHKITIEPSLWVHELVHFLFATIYSLYLYCSYRMWVADNLKVVVMPRNPE